MSFYVPDRQLRASELLIPGRKPTGPVVVDTEHRFAPDKFCYLLGGAQSSHGGNQIDYVEKAVATRLGTDNISPRYGDLLNLANEVSSTSTASARYSLKAIGSMPTGTACFVALSENFITNDIQFVFSHGDTPNSARVYFGFKYASSGVGNLLFRLGSGSESTGSYAISQGQRVTAVMTWNNGTAEIAVNGVYDANYTYTGTPGSTTADVTSIGAFTYPASVQVPLDGAIGMVCLSSQYIGKGGAVELSSDPYQFLKPRGTV